VRALAQEPERKPDLGAEVEPAVAEQERLVARVGARLLDLRLGAVALRRVVARFRRELRGERGVALGRDVLVARAVEQRGERLEVGVGPAERQVAIEPQLERSRRKTRISACDSTRRREVSPSSTACSRTSRSQNALNVAIVAPTRP